MRLIKLTILIIIWSLNCFSSQSKNAALVYCNQYGKPFELQIVSNHIKFVPAIRETDEWIYLKTGKRINKKQDWLKNEEQFPSFDCEENTVTKDGYGIRIKQLFIPIKEEFESIGRVNYWKGFYLIEVMIKGWGVPGRGGFYHAGVIAYNEYTQTYQFIDVNHVGFGLFVYIY